MFVTVHTAVAVALTQNFTSPLLVALLGFISHWVLDMLPHGDEILTKGWSKTKVLLVLGLPDILILITGLITYLTLITPPQLMVVLAATFGAVLPDILWGLSVIIKWRWLQNFYNFHEKVHYLLYRIKLPMWIGFGIQILFLFIAISTLLN